MSDPTSAKISSGTRGHSWSFNRRTLEDTIDDALDETEFWIQATVFDTWRRALPAERRRAIDDRDREMQVISARLW